jgi:hypothetical protein
MNEPSKVKRIAQPLIRTNGEVAVTEPLTLVDAMSLGERLPIGLGPYPTGSNACIKGRQPPPNEGTIP